MNRSRGNPAIAVGLIDGPLAMDHPDIQNENLQEISGPLGGKCTQNSSPACLHGTFVGGILKGKRNSGSPAICPDCTLLVRPIFNEVVSIDREMPSAPPEELAQAVIDCIRAGARVLNLSVTLSQPSPRGERQLHEAFSYAAHRNVILVAAAGNHGNVGGSAITSHPWVISAIACDLKGRPLTFSDLGNSIGRRGFSAPGDKITSLRAGGGLITMSGTSVSTPFVTGIIALLWSEVPSASAAQIKFAMNSASTPRRTSVVPPLVNAWGAYQAMIRSSVG
jgi:subtilisin family serine protease